MALPSDTELVETLGEGSFGTVYVARLKEGAIHRTVVLKVLKASWVDNEDILNRSKDEAALLARLNHDNIVKVEQLTTLQGRPAVVMEYVRGLTLDTVIKKHGAIPVGVALQIMARVASALDAAYNKVPPGMDEPLRVVHRDIKPSNIILSVNGAVKVLDFGTARGEFSDREAETVAVTLGSPRYMAPERFDGVNSGPAIDIYAMGVTFYELLGGRSMGRMPLNPERHVAKVEQALDALRPKKGGGKDLEALLGLIKDCLAYEHENRIGAKDFRKRTLDILSKLSGATVTLDVFSETVIEPIWEKRSKTPAAPLDQENADLFVAQGSSASIATKSGLSGQSAASSLVVAAGGGGKVALLLGGGLLIALGGLLALKTGLKKEATSTASTPLEAAVTESVPGPIRSPAAQNTNASETSAPKTDSKATLPESTNKPEESLEAPQAPAPPSQQAGNAPTSTNPAASSAQRSATPTNLTTVKLASAPPASTLRLGSSSYTLPGKYELPAGNQQVEIEFADGTVFDCELQIAEGKIFFFRKRGEVCP